MWFTSDPKSFNIKIGQVAMVVGIESMDRASRPSSECSSFVQIQSIQCATKRFKICQSGLVLSDSIVFFIFQVTDGAPQKRPRN